MHRAAGLIGGLILIASAVSARAQEFVPPDRAGRPAPPPANPPANPPAAVSQAPASTGSSFRAGIFGFTTRGGMQVSRGSQAVIGSTVDVLQLGAPAVRLRPSFEMGFGSSEKSVGVNTEVIYRFQPDPAPAIPYLGLGLGYHDDSTGTGVWPTVVMGFELNFNRSMNWLIEMVASEPSDAWANTAS